MLVVLARHDSPPAPTPMTEIDWPDLSSSMLHMYVSNISDVSEVWCNCFILVLQK